MSSLEQVLLQNRHQFTSVTHFNFEKEPFHIFDFTSNNSALLNIDLNNEQAFTDYVFNTLYDNSCSVGVGGYGEDRFIYSRSEVFGGEESRSIHLGIDVWAAVGTAVYTPLDGTVHSFANNNQHGDYGPTIILGHQLENVKFYTLYGHLNTECLNDLFVGKKLKKGDHIANFGTYEENVHWPPHLHFQIIHEIGDYSGDYPGVAKPSEKEKWLKNSPDANLILNIKGL
ncbi:peptidoglycan DD-metalloendopeptidase family protein [Fulvivirga sp.]|uniref:peptidoglycan DD-metalloendopeptidase family protein n=1 Tax=Fulvivirga sp. TaxID=1931237 RepID=UPI0032EF5F31